MRIFGRGIQDPPKTLSCGASGIAIAGLVLGVVGTAVAISALAISIVALVLVLKRTTKLETMQPLPQPEHEQASLTHPTAMEIDRACKNKNE